MLERLWHKIKLSKMIKENSVPFPINNSASHRTDDLDILYRNMVGALDLQSMIERKMRSYKVMIDTSFRLNVECSRLFEDEENIEGSCSSCPFFRWNKLKESLEHITTI